MGVGECPITSLHDSLEPVCLKEVDHVFRGEIVERRLDKIGIGTDVLAELVPRLSIGEIAASFPREKDFPAGPGHLLEYGYPCSRKRFSRSISCHQSGGTSAYDKYVRFHIIKKNIIFAIPFPLRNVQATLAQR